ncbi:hypothetical protein [Methyloglobulus sp.]|uniref:hypothetical protein n=1 Tax=Methyloglobulus sp. TaxID=2518622 RepID=UPI0032B765EF
MNKTIESQGEREFRLHKAESIVKWATFVAHYIVVYPNFLQSSGEQINPVCFIN